MSCVRKLTSKEMFELLFKLVMVKFNSMVSDGESVFVVFSFNCISSLGDEP